MVRSRTRERGKVGEGESEVQIIIGESTVEPSKNGVGLFVRPGKKAIREINLR